jgi:hypothetical protein
MRIDKTIYVKVAQAICRAGGGDVGPWSPESGAWFVGNRLPEEIRQLFEKHIPKQELWAGAGALFDEVRIIKWNSDFPAGLGSNLLIVGTAANGDHIAIDLKNGSTGYISHAQDWGVHPRAFFVPVSPSSGCYLRDISHAPSIIPEDYWEAKKL